MIHSSTIDAERQSQLRGEGVCVCMCVCVCVCVCVRERENVYMSTGIKCVHEYMYITSY